MRLSSCEIRSVLVSVLAGRLLTCPPSLLHFPSDKQPEPNRLLRTDTSQTYTGSGKYVCARV